MCTTASLPEACKSIEQARLLHFSLPMPYFHEPPDHANQAREKREMQLGHFDLSDLDLAYKVSQRLPLDGDTSGVPAEAKIEAILIGEFGPID